MTKSGLGELYDAYFKTRFGYDARRDQVWKEVVRWIQAHHIDDGSRVVDLGRATATSSTMW